MGKVIHSTEGSLFLRVTRPEGRSFFLTEFPSDAALLGWATAEKLPAGSRCRWRPTGEQLQTSANRFTPVRGTERKIAYESTSRYE